MAEPREPLEVRVDDEADDRDRPQPARRSGRAARRRRGRARATRAQKTTTWTIESWPLGISRPAVRGFRASIPRVDQPVERHRERARADHRERDPEQVVPARRPVHREERADVRERQREDRVLDLHEPREPRRQRRRSRRGGHVCSCAVGIVGEELERVGERRAENREAVAAAAGRAGQIDDERRAERRRPRRARAGRAASSRSSPPAAPARCPAPRGRARRASPPASRPAARARSRRS